jgi:ligand-binding sensor domain-containing protein/serine phosphatase RsbU (regulator of sigma subunit)
MIKKAVYLLVLVFCLLELQGFAQLYNFKNFNTKNGLANSNVNFIYQTSNGYVWFATQGGGISRFDGKEFKNYSKEDGLISSDITALCEDKENNLWIGTAEGVSRFDGKSFHNFTDSKSPLSKTIVYSIKCDNKGSLWFATFDKGLVRYRHGAITTFDTTRGLPTNAVFDIHQDKKGDYWVGLFHEGLIKINEEGKTLYKSKDLGSSIANLSVFTLGEDKNGTLWVGTAGSGIYYLKHEKFELFDSPETQKDIIAKIVFDSRNNVWCATEHGLLKIGEKYTKLFQEKDGLPSERVQALMVDYEGNLWIGTYGGGASLFTNESIVTFTENDGLRNTKINAIHKTHDGHMLMGTFTGLFHNVGKGFEKIKGKPEFENSSISAIFEDSKGNIWVGTETEGLMKYRYEGDNLVLQKNYRKNIDGTDITQVMKVIEDRHGKVWFTCYGHGLFRYTSDENIEHFSMEGNTLPTNDIINVYEDANGKIWVGSYGYGVMLFDGKAFQSLNNAPSNLNNIFAIAGDPEGNVYFGSFDAGLIVYTPKGEYKIFTKKNGLCANNVQSLLFEKGFLWVGTDKGINKLKFDKNYTIQSIRFYNENDGFKSAEINPNSISADANSVIWFGTTNGATRYDPNYDYPNLTAPKLLLSEIKLSYQHIDWSQYADSIDPKNDLPVGLKLSHKNNNLTFIFQATTTDNVKYQFVLEGTGDDWSPMNDRNEAVFTNIPPGVYTFKVRAQNSNGVWSNEVLEYPFEITPPFWKTWWFYTLSVIVILFALFSFFRYRTAQLEKEKRILEQKVEERTVELKEANHKLFDALHDIKDSINYAEKIQRAILPTPENIQLTLPQSFILFRPRDVVSGDFYWHTHRNEIDYIAAVDCTGHGVPGAFMSMIGSSLLNEIVQTLGTNDPSKILAQLNQGVQDALKQNENQSRDGMDLALCAIDYKNKKLHYAGANRPLWIVKAASGELIEIKATKTAIGGFTDYNHEYQSHEVKLDKNDTVYMFTDGFPDQFGGPQGKKLMTKRFKEMLSEIQKLDMGQQGKSLDFDMNDWMGTSYEQVDDILVIGVKF